MLYFLEGVLPFLTSFYQYFYYPERHSHPNELDETDHIAKAVVVFVLNFLNSVQNTDNIVLDSQMFVIFKLFDDQNYSVYHVNYATILSALSYIFETFLGNFSRLRIKSDGFIIFNK
jgi:hypothetical protein